MLQSWILMVITYHGEGCLRLQSGDTSLLVDPANNRFKADVTLRTEYAGSETETEPQEEISHAGEYEIKDIEIIGVQLSTSSADKSTSSNDKSTSSEDKSTSSEHGYAALKTKSTHTAYAVRWEEIRLAFLGHLEHTPGIEILDRIGEVDVLFLGIGGAYLPEKEAVTLIKKLSPSIVVPFFGKNENEFLKTIDQKPKPIEKFVFKKKDLVPEAQTVMLLEAK